MLADRTVREVFGEPSGLGEHLGRGRAAASLGVNEREVGERSGLFVNQSRRGGERQCSGGGLFTTIEGVDGFTRKRFGEHVKDDEFLGGQSSGCHLFAGLGLKGSGLNDLTCGGENACVTKQERAPDRAGLKVDDLALEGFAGPRHLPEGLMMMALFGVDVGEFEMTLANSAGPLVLLRPGEVLFKLLARLIEAAELA